MILKKRLTTEGAEFAEKKSRTSRLDRTRSTEEFA